MQKALEKIQEQWGQNKTCRIKQGKDVFRSHLQKEETNFDLINS